MIGFHNVRFPEDVSWRSSGGPLFKTQVFQSFRGYEKRNIDWSQPQMQFNVAYGVKTDVQVLNLFSFFNARQGRAYGFRYKNWANYRIQNNAFATGDGFNNRLPIWRFYGFQGARMYKRLRKIVPGSVRNVGVGSIGGLVEGVDYTIDYDTGEIALNYPPGYGVPVFAENLEYDEPVRFDTDTLQSIFEGFNNQSLNNIPLLGVKAIFKSGSVFAPNETVSSDDSFFENVRLILNFDDVEDTSTTIDQSELAFPVVSFGDSTLVPDVFRHGRGSFYSGTNGGLQIGGESYDLNSTPFTIEGFLQQATSGEINQTIIGKWEESGQKRCWLLRYLLDTKRIQFVISSDGSQENVVLNYPWTPTSKDFFDYISVNRTSAGWYVLRINGIVVQQIKTNEIIFDADTPLVVGNVVSPVSGQGPYQGLMDSIRITVGRARDNNLDNSEIPSAYPV